MSLLVACSVFRSVQDTSPVSWPVSWEDLAARLTSPTYVTNKTDVGLWNAAAYEHGANRKSDSIISIGALVIDFDNSEEYTDETGKHKRCVANPTRPEGVETRLVGREFIVASTFSNTPEWPRFRLVLPLAEAVPPGGWPERAQGLMTVLQLAELAGIDSVYRNANAIYYWPSLPPGSPGTFRHHKGIYLSPEVPGVVTEPGSRLTRANQDERFTSDQVEKYYRDRVPEFEMQDNGFEFRGMCPFHGGEGALNFTINKTTGLWLCHSKCVSPNGKRLGGDLYEFEMRKFELDFRTAKIRVNKLLDVDEDRHVYKPFEVIQQEIESSTPDHIPALKQAVAAHGNLRQRKELIKQLITTHQLDDSAVREEIAILRSEIKSKRDNVVQFPRQNDEAAARLAADQKIEEAMRERKPDMFGLCLPPNKYYLDLTGVYPVRGVTRGDQFEYEPQFHKPVLPRPLWPVLMGDDVITGETYMLLAWFKSDKTLIKEWMPGDRSNNRDVLLALNDAPVSIPHTGEVSEYLSIAKSCVTAPRRKIATSIGWVQGNTRFITDNDPDVTYIGKPINRRGSVQAWADTLKEIVDEGPAGYSALAVVGLAAASPVIRLLGKRNPVLGLVSDSSRGKGTVINFALSIWNEPTALTIPAGSTDKGMQDVSIGSSDQPVFADEMQQLKKQDVRRVEGVIYYFANGQRRVTSSRNQVAKGGERRWGPAFYAAEAPILDGTQMGVQFRTIEIVGDPLPNAAIANRIQFATQENVGKVGMLIADLINTDHEMITSRARTLAHAIHFSNRGLEGDDAYALASVKTGLEILHDVLGIDTKPSVVLGWLMSALEKQRINTKDIFSAVWEQIMAVTTGHLWGEMPAHDVYEQDGTLVAFRKDKAMDKNISILEINPSARVIADVLRLHQAHENFARVWADRGWIIKNGEDLKWVRKHPDFGNGLRVWRVSEAGLAQVGLRGDLEAL